MLDFGGGDSIEGEGGYVEMALTIDSQHLPWYA